MEIFKEDAEILEYFLISIYRYLASSENDYKYSIHVSDLVYDCMRRAYYQKIYPTVIDLDSAIRMAFGKAVHEIPFYRSTHHELELEWNGIVAHIDEYFEDIMKIIDKKTCRQIPNRPYDHHIKQVEMYAVIAAEHGYNVQKVGILYIDVANASAKAFEWEPIHDPLQLKEEMLWKRDVLKKALIENTPPPRKISWECKYCGYAYICFGKDTEKQLEIAEPGGEQVDLSGFE